MRHIRTTLFIYHIVNTFRIQVDFPDISKPGSHNDRRVITHNIINPHILLRETSMNVTSTVNSTQAPSRHTKAPA